MPQRISRREFARKAATAGLAVAAATSIAQDAKKPAAKKPIPEELMAEADLKSLEAKLEKPLPAKLKAPAKAAMMNVRKQAADRRKFALPEGSEPCTTFIPSSARVVDR